MSNDAARLEALGERHVTFQWRRVALTIPLRLEDWPLAPLRAGRYFAGVDALLNNQPIPPADPLVDDYRELSDAMAEACGVGRLPEQPPAPDAWFGGVPRLLHLLRDYEDDVASDLQRFWHIDYRDRFTGGLTMRRIWSCVRRSQPTSALAIAGNYGREVWTEQTFATARVWEALTGQHYEGRPLTEPELAKVIEAMQQRQARVDKLRARREHYHPEDTSTLSPGDPRTAGVNSALAEAIKNRRAQMGVSEVDGNQGNSN